MSQVETINEMNESLVESEKPVDDVESMDFFVTNERERIQEQMEKVIANDEDDPAAPEAQDTALWEDSGISGVVLTLTVGMVGLLLVARRRLISTPTPDKRDADSGTRHDNTD